MGFLQVSILLPSVTVGLVAGVMTITGIRLGDRLGGQMTRWARLFGGLILIGIGLRVLPSHLAG